METEKENNWQEMLTTEPLGSLGKIAVSTKNIIMLSGQSMAGKTASCLHICDSAIRNEKSVLYFDTEEKKIIERVEPNLFKFFFNKNPETYKKFFHYRTNLDNWIDDVREINPKLVIIDSLYVPFLHAYKEQRVRAKKIKEFLIEFRAVMWEKKMGAIITVPTGRIVDPTEGKAKLVPLGGEGVKYLADVKVMIHFAEHDNSDAETGGSRFFVVDRNVRYAFRIKEGGILQEL